MANYIGNNKFSGNEKGAIFNAGANAKIINNDFINQDRAIVNVGKNMRARRRTTLK